MNFLSTGTLICLAIVFVWSCSVFAQNHGITNTVSSPYAVNSGVDIDDVRWTKGFWAKKFDVCRTAMIPNMWNILKNPDISHAYTNFLICAGIEKGEFKGTWWMDGDFYKWVEAAAYMYAATNDEDLLSLMDEVIAVIEKAQRENGYIHTAIIIGSGAFDGRTREVAFSGKTKPFQDLRWM